MKRKFISVIRWYHKQIFSFEKEQNYHMLPLEVMHEEWYTCELFAINAGVKIEEDPNFVKWVKVIYYKNIFQYLCYLWRNRHAVIYSNTLTIKTLLVWLIGKKTVFMAHDQVWPLKSKMIKQLVVRFFYRFFSFIRVINPGEAELLKSKKISSYVLPLVVSTKFYNDDYNDRKDMVFIWNIYADKNPEFLIDTMSIIKEKKWHIKLYIIGEDRYLHNGKTFHDIIYDNWLQEYIILLWFIPHTKLGDVLKTKKIFVNTSISEWQCLAAYEWALSWCVCCLQNILSFPSVFLDDALYHNTPWELAKNVLSVDRDYISYKPKIYHLQEMILKNYNYDYLKQETKKMFLEIDK